MPSHERSFRTPAVILRRQDFGEADRLLVVLTPEHGKLRAIAKGARKPQSRKAGHIELFMRTKMLFARGRALDLVTQAELIDAYRPLREELVRVTYASGISTIYPVFGGPVGRLWRSMASG